MVKVIAWVLVDKHSKPVKWASILSHDPTGGGTDYTRIVADDLEPQGAPHIWQPCVPYIK